MLSQRLNIKRKILLLSMTLIILPELLFGQDSLSGVSVFRLSGYVKGMQWTTFTDQFNKHSSTVLLHNRLNGRWEFSNIWEGRLEVRNRVFAGEDVRQNPGFGKQLNNSGDWLKLNATAPDSSSYVFHTNIERAWLQFKKGKWNVRAGRQRINWGMTNVWNPNDIFNYYNVLDFDYEERAGADAVNLKFMPDDLSGIELAFAKTSAKPVYALKYSTNYKKYDLQALIGSYQNTFTAGGGWAGSIRDMGFKGEIQYFKSKLAEPSDLFVSTELDYLFKNGQYTSFSVLYNHRGRNQALQQGENLLFQLSPRNLMPARWNFLVNTTKEFTPIFSGSLNVIYAPKVNMLILFPSLKYNVATNLDLDLFWQSFFFQYRMFEAMSHTAFLRIKWSF